MRFSFLNGLILCFTRYRHLLAYFVIGDLKVRYRRSVAGYFWTLLEPLSLVLTYFFLFAIVMRVDQPAYPVVLLVGLLPWNFFNAVVQTGSYALVSNAGLIQKVYLPREIFIVTTVGYNLFVFLASLLVVVPFLVWFRIVPQPRAIVALPFAILLLTLLATGFAFIFACLNVRFRDIGDVLRVVLRLAIYFTPILYTVPMVPEKWRTLYLLNPVSIAILLFRVALMNDPMQASPKFLVAATIFSFAVFFGGLWTFSRWEGRLVKYL